MLVKELLMNEEVANIINDRDPSYIPVPDKKQKKKKRPESDKVRQSLVNTLWSYDNADAS